MASGHAINHRCSDRRSRGHSGRPTQDAQGHAHGGADGGPDTGSDRRSARGAGQGVGIFGSVFSHLSLLDSRGRLPHDFLRGQLPALGAAGSVRCHSNVWRRARRSHQVFAVMGTPLFVLDLYAHAYHIDFGAAAARYVDAFLANTDRDEVQRRLEAARQG